MNNIKQLKEYFFYKSNKLKINSKDIVKGDVFLALPGKNSHGNVYISKALKNGASFVITDIIYKQKKNENIIVVKNLLKFILLIAKQKRNLFKGKVIGITGSIGKTSVKENLKYLLSINYNVSASIKSYNNYLGVLISLINLDLKSDYAIFEIGTNNFSEIKKLTSIVKPMQAVVTNILPTHLENFINTKNIAKEKSDIFYSKYNPNIELLVTSNNNIDESYIIKKAVSYKLKKILTFGNDNKSNLYVIQIREFDKSFIKIKIKYLKKNYEIILKKDQLNKINNILICFIIFKFNRIKINNFLNFSKKIPLIEGRGLNHKIFFNNKKIRLIDESYNASPVSMKACILDFKNLKIKKNEKKILILGEMKELGDSEITYHIEILRLINEFNIKNAIICGQLMKIALDKIENINKILFVANEKKMLNHLNKIIKENDTIVIKGSNSSLTNKISSMLLNKGNK